MSHFTNGSTTTLVHRHDGHKEGYLNCVAVRHGWTRTFSISPDELSALDYTQLEKVLELGTLKLRPLMVRIYVEEPANSGTFGKVRYWKDDGSLQSVLVKEFFAKRCANGGVTTFELRDGRDRREEGDGDGESVFASKTNLALAKLRRKTSLRSNASVPVPTPKPKPTVATGTARFFDFFRLPRSIKPNPPPSVTSMAFVDDVDDDEETEPDLPARAADPEEQALLQNRGWMPPLLRRVYGGDTPAPAPVPTPAASSSAAARRSSGKGKGRADPLDATTPAPGEDDAHPLSDDDWEVQDALPMDPLAQRTGKNRPGIFARLNSKDKDRDEVGGKEGKKKSKGKKKKEKDAAGTTFQGAQRVQRPEDAMPPPSPAPQEGSSTTKNPFDD